MVGTTGEEYTSIRDLRRYFSLFKTVDDVPLDANGFYSFQLISQSQAQNKEQKHQREEKDSKARSVKYHKATSTAFKISNTAKEYFRLESLMFFLKNLNIPRGTYFKQAAEQDVQPVKYIDREPLLNYLAGKIKAADVKNIDPAFLEQKEGSSSRKKGEKNDNRKDGLDRKRKGMSGKEGRDKRGRKSVGGDRSRKRGKLMKYWESREQPISTLDSILRCKVDIGRIIRPIVEAYKERKRAPRPPTSLPPRLSSGQRKRMQQAEETQRRRARPTPIILVPGSTSASITLGNVQQFLENGEFNDTTTQSPLKKVRRQSHPPKQQAQFDKGEVTIRRNMLKYRVLNNPNKLEPRDWENVVACFVQGQKWQFRNWRQFRSEADIFDNILGVYVYFEGERVHPNVAAWNVKTYKIKRQQRSLDQIQSHRIWEEIDKFIMNKKPYLV